MGDSSIIKIFISAAFLFSGCGEPCSKEHRHGLYLVRYFETGDCGPTPSIVTDLSLDAPEGCERTSVRWSDDECSSFVELVCDNEQTGHTVYAETVLTEVEGTSGDKIEGSFHVEAIDSSDGTHVCSSVYTVNATRTRD